MKEEKNSPNYKSERVRSEHPHSSLGDYPFQLQSLPSVDLAIFISNGWHLKPPSSKSLNPTVLVFQPFDIMVFIRLILLFVRYHPTLTPSFALCFIYSPSSSVRRRPSFDVVLCCHSSICCHLLFDVILHCHSSLRHCSTLSFVSFVIVCVLSLLSKLIHNN
jgi:hypothetical protein